MWFGITEKAGSREGGFALVKVGAAMRKTQSETRANSGGEGDFAAALASYFACTFAVPIVGRFVVEHTRAGDRFRVSDRQGMNGWWRTL